VYNLGNVVLCIMLKQLKSTPYRCGYI